MDLSLNYIEIVLIATVKAMFSLPGFCCFTYKLICLAWLEWHHNRGNLDLGWWITCEQNVCGWCLGLFSEPFMGDGRPWLKTHHQPWGDFETLQQHHWKGDEWTSPSSAYPSPSEICCPLDAPIFFQHAWSKSEVYWSCGSAQASTKTKCWKS